MTASKPQVSIVAAIGKNRVLGKDNQLLWHISADLKRFKALTLGHPVIMGRKTFESIIASLGHPLPGRQNIVISHKGPTSVESGDNPIGRSLAETAIFTGSIQEALEKAAAFDKEEIFVIGGGQIYKEAMPLIDKLYLTLIDGDKDGDTYFPEYEDQFTKKTFEEEREWNGLKYRWVDLER
jgi:dihydrofolate reductase